MIRNIQVLSIHCIAVLFENDWFAQNNFLIWFVGLKLQGAECSQNTLSLVDSITTELPDVCLQWTKIDPLNPPVVSGNDVTLPVYLNQTRRELLFTVDMSTSGAVPARSFYERGVAFIVSFLTG